MHYHKYNRLQKKNSYALKNYFYGVDSSCRKTKGLWGISHNRKSVAILKDKSSVEMRSVSNIAFEIWPMLQLPLVTIVPGLPYCITIFYSVIQ